MFKALVECVFFYAKTLWARFTNSSSTNTLLLLKKILSKVIAYLNALVTLRNRLITTILVLITNKVNFINRLVSIANTFYY